MKGPVRIILASVLSFLFTAGTTAQELNCTVQVAAPQVQGTDRQVFETLRKEITEFMNNTKWTSDQFLNQERIECSILITVSDRIGSDEFKASIQVQTRRPVYKTSYNSTLFNFNDENFTFKYVEYEPLEFNEQTFISTLTSALAFYAYIIIGLDYDSFSPRGGEPYFQKAMNIVNNATVAKEKGWKAFEGTRNRYWIAENLTNVQMRAMHDIYYDYHRMGLDIMEEKLPEGRLQILESLEALRKLNQEKPGTVIMQTFFAAKADEFVNIFSEAPPVEKARVYNFLNELDPTNITKYQKLTGGR
jgi:hypothetical protein